MLSADKVSLQEVVAAEREAFIAGGKQRAARLLARVHRLAARLARAMASMLPSWEVSQPTSLVMPLVSCRAVARATCGDPHKLAVADRRLARLVPRRHGMRRLRGATAPWRLRFARHAAQRLMQSVRRVASSPASHPTVPNEGFSLRGVGRGLLWRRRSHHGCDVRLLRRLPVQSAVRGCRGSVHGTSSDMPSMASHPNVLASSVGDAQALVWMRFASARLILRPQ